MSDFRRLRAVSHRFKRLPCFEPKFAWVIRLCCYIWSGRLQVSIPTADGGVQRTRPNGTMNIRWGMMEESEYEAIMPG